MTLVLVAVVRSTNIVVEGELTVTDEELEKMIQEVCDSIDNLPDLEGPLSKQEQIHRETLRLRKGYLYRVRDAREKSDPDEERYNLSAYGLVTALGEKHSNWVDFLLKYRFRKNYF